tara:strand:+ start:548 stop:778 length:231 start_codon:yes stop_codon:yes gene_type:complete
MASDLGLIAVLITTCASAIVAVISQIQHSRCENIKLCCGLFECIRNVPDVHEPEVQMSPVHHDIPPVHPLVPNTST